MSRDFTVNSLSYDLRTGQVQDWLRGKAVRDLKENKLELVEKDGFEVDPIRMLRIIRFAAKYHMTIGAKEWRLLHKK